MDSAPTTPIPNDLNAHTETTRSDLHRFRLAMAVIWTIAIMVLCWIPGSLVHEIEDESRWFKIPSLDKMVHAGIFIVFPILWARVGTSRRRFVWIFLGGVALGVTTELVQELAVIGRDGNIADAIVDIAGILLGIVAVPLVEPLARAVESRLFRKTAPSPSCVSK